MLARIDHLIQEVVDIERTHRALLDQGFDEAWPIGPYWPSARTSGIALGGLNLELVQRSSPTREAITTFVFEPDDLNLTESQLAASGVSVNRFVKVEPNPELLRLRGFENAIGPEEICTNLLPESPLPFEWFVCRYVPFLYDRLNPKAFRQPLGKLLRVELGTPQPAEAAAFLAEHYRGGIEIHLVAAEFATIQRLVFESATLDAPLGSY